MALTRRRHVLCTIASVLVLGTVHVWGSPAFAALDSFLNFPDCSGVWSDTRCWITNESPPQHRPPQPDDVVSIFGGATLDTNATVMGLGIVRGSLSQPGNVLQITTGLSVTNGGSYSQTGGTILVGVGESVSSGSFTQTDGTNSVGFGFLVVDAVATSVTPSYNLSGGVLNVLREAIGANAAGTFTQSDGFNSVGQLTLGGAATGRGGYGLSGTGALAATEEFIGASGNGTFVQTDASTNTVNGTLSIGSSPGSSGEYDLNGGTLTVTAVVIGAGADEGQFIQNGGTHTADSIGVTGSASSGLSSYTLNAPGAIIVRRVFIGGLFSQFGGTQSVTDSLFINPGAGYTVQGGALTVFGGVIDNFGAFHYLGGSISANVTNEAGANFFVGGGGMRTLVGSFTNLPGGTLAVAPDTMFCSAEGCVSGTP